jgi:hypothetical protein
MSAHKACKRIGNKCRIIIFLLHGSNSVYWSVKNSILKERNVLPNQQSILIKSFPPKKKKNGKGHQIEKKKRNLTMQANTDQQELKGVLIEAAKRKKTLMPSANK